MHLIALLACGQTSGLRTPDVVITDPTNYRYEPTLEIDTVPLRSGSDPLLSWGSVGMDNVGRPVAPIDDVDTVFITVFDGMDPDELTEALAYDVVPQTELDLFVHYDTLGTTQARLSDFTMMTTDIDVEQYFVEDSGTWLAVLVSETALGAYRKLLYLSPEDDAPDDLAYFDDDCSSYEVDVDLASLQLLEAPADTVVELHWDELGTDGLGQDLALHKLDELVVGHYEDLEPADLEQDFFVAEENMDRRWSMDVSGQVRVDLADLEGPDAFDGFSADGTWVVALRCGSCSSPMPRYLGIVSVAP